MHYRVTFEFLRKYIEIKIERVRISKKDVLTRYIVQII